MRPVHVDPASALQANDELVVIVDVRDPLAFWHFTVDAKSQYPDAHDREVDVAGMDGSIVLHRDITVP